jgi:2-hydroxychromene-2-carboxylate isomerase
MQELRRQSAKAGMPLTLQPAFFPTNPAPAAYAIIAAQKAGGGDIHTLVQSLCAACWAEDKNVAEDDVIRDCLGRAGFDTGIAFSGMLTGAEVYPRNLDEAVAAGVFGVPFFLVGDERFWGQDRLEDLDLYLSGTL